MCVRDIHAPANREPLGCSVNEWNAVHDSAGNYTKGYTVVEIMRAGG